MAISASATTHVINHSHHHTPVSVFACKVVTADDRPSNRLFLTAATVSALSRCLRCRQVAMWTKSAWVNPVWFTDLLHSFTAACGGRSSRASRSGSAGWSALWMADDEGGGNPLPPLGISAIPTLTSTAEDTIKVTFCQMLIATPSIGKRPRLTLITSLVRHGQILGAVSANTLARPRGRRAVVIYVKDDGAAVIEPPATFS
jgi:hypothetical protein